MVFGDMKKNRFCKSYNFIGAQVEALTYQDLFDRVDRWISDKSSRSHHVAIINSNCATVAFQNKRVSDIYNKADLIGPDGMPFVYWLRWKLKMSCNQFDASSIVIKLAEKAKEKHYKFYLYGGHPDVAKKMKKKLKELYPHINIVGYRSPLDSRRAFVTHVVDSQKKLTQWHRYMEGLRRLFDTTGERLLSKQFGDLENGLRAKDTPTGPQS